MRVRYAAWMPALVRAVAALLSLSAVFGGGAPPSRASELASAAKSSGGGPPEGSVRASPSRPRAGAPASRASDLPAAVATGQVQEPTSSAIAFLEDKVRRDPDDFIALNLLAGRYLERLREGGGDRDLSLAEDAARRSLRAMPAELNVGGLTAQARADYAAHRFAAARDGASRLIALAPGKSFPYQVLGDASLELGSYDKAAAAYKEMQRLDGSTVEAESRMARLALAHGQTERVRKHLAAALALAQDLAPPSPAVVSWCHVQMGQFCFGRGEWEKAEEEYRAALEAMPNGLLALEHFAELRAAQSKYDEAIDLYGRVIARSLRPEFRQALGDVYAFMGNSSDAKLWHGRALAGYMDSVREGHVHYYHHLTGFYSDSEPDAAAALTWARKDLELRRSINAFDALAWALYRSGQYSEASAAMKNALSLGTEDAHLLYHAGIIESSAGNVASGSAFLRRAVQVNPRYNAFHVHR